MTTLWEECVNLNAENKKLKDTIKHLNRMIDAHMNVIDKYIIKVARIEGTTVNPDVLWNKDNLTIDAVYGQDEKYLSS